MPGNISLLTIDSLSYHLILAPSFTDKRKFCIAELPRAWNQGAIDDAQWHIYSNGGYGNLLDPALYDTNQFVADSLFFSSLRNSAISRLDCEDADVVLVPVISSAFFTQSRRQELVSIFQELPSYLPFLHKKPHFAILGFIEECVTHASEHNFVHGVEGILDAPHPNLWFGVLEKRYNWAHRYPVSIC